MDTRTIQLKGTVTSDHSILVSSPELPVGTEVTVKVEVPVEHRRAPIMDILTRLPACRTFKSAKEVDDYIRQERDSWE